MLDNPRQAEALSKVEPAKRVEVIAEAKNMVAKDGRSWQDGAESVEANSRHFTAAH